MTPNNKSKTAQKCDLLRAQIYMTQIVSYIYDSDSIGALLRALTKKVSSMMNFMCRVHPFYESIEHYPWTIYVLFLKSKNMSSSTLASAIHADLAAIYKAFPAFNLPGWFHTTTTAPNLMQD